MVTPRILTVEASTPVVADRAHRSEDPTDEPVANSAPMPVILMGTLTSASAMGEGVGVMLGVTPRLNDDVREEVGECDPVAVDVLTGVQDDDWDDVAVIVLVRDCDSVAALEAVVELVLENDETAVDVKAESLVLEGVMSAELVRDGIRDAVPEADPVLEADVKADLEYVETANCVTDTLLVEDAVIVGRPEELELEVTEAERPDDTVRIDVREEVGERESRLVALADIALVLVPLGMDEGL